MQIEIGSNLMYTIIMLGFLLTCIFIAYFALYEGKEDKKMKKNKMKLTVTWNENSEDYSVATDFTAFNLGIFLEAVSSVIAHQRDVLVEENISPADVGFMLSMALTEDMFGDDEDEEQ